MGRGGGVNSVGLKGQKNKETVKADLHGTTLSLVTRLRQAYDMNCFL